MGQIQKQLFFGAPVDRVWGIWTDVEKTPQWVKGVQESQRTSAVNQGRGLSWSEKCLFDEKTIQMEHEVTEWEDKKRTVIQTGLPMGGKMQRTAEFKATPNGTEVFINLEWDLGMIGAFVAEEKVQQMLEKGLEATAANWKELVEKDSVN